MLKIRYSVFFGLLISAIAFAHTHIITSHPQAGAVIASKPTTINIKFDSQIEPVFSTLIVVDQGHRQVSENKGLVEKSNPYMITTNIPALPNGEYQVNWSIVTLDGHRQKGHFLFSVK